MENILQNWNNASINLIVLYSLLFKTKSKKVFKKFVKGSLEQTLGIGFAPRICFQSPNNLGFGISTAIFLNVFMLRLAACIACKELT